MNVVRESLIELAPVIPAPEPPFDTARLNLAVGSWLAAEPVVSAATPVYYLTLNDLAEGAGLEAARLKSWRFLVGRENQIVGTVDIGVDDDGGAAAPASFADADPVTIGSLIGSSIFGQGGEPRLLDVAPLYVLAVWIHHDGPEEDFVIPLLPESQSFGEPTRAATFAEELRQQARQLLETPHEEEDSAP